MPKHINKKDVIDYKEMLHVQPIAVIVPASLFEDHCLKLCIIYISLKEYALADVMNEWLKGRQKCHQVGIFTAELKTWEKFIKSWICYSAPTKQWFPVGLFNSQMAEKTMLNDIEI